MGKTHIQAFMEIAIEHAKRSTMESKHGCVIINSKAQNKLVAASCNEHIANQEDRSVFSIHAEVNALAQLLRIKSHNNTFFEHCVAFVARVGPPSSNFKVRMSKPCQNCQKMLRKLGIRKVFYTIDEHNIQELTFHQF